MTERRKFSDYEKKTVYARGNGRCAVCGRPINFEGMTIDHRIPLSRGGTNEFSNLQPTCGVKEQLSPIEKVADQLDKLTIES